MKLVFYDKHGWPVERFKGRPITNAIRLLLHCKKVRLVRKGKEALHETHIDRDQKFRCTRNPEERTWP